MSYRQGDVLLIPTKIPIKAKPVEAGNIILAYGENTGHHHTLKTAQLLETPTQRFVKLEQSAVLEHQEHAPIQIPPGTYEVIRQVEYTNVGLRNVQD